MGGVLPELCRFGSEFWELMCIDFCIMFKYCIPIACWYNFHCYVQTFQGTWWGSLYLNCLLWIQPWLFIFKEVLHFTLPMHMLGDWSYKVVVMRRYIESPVVFWISFLCPLQEYCSFMVFIYISYLCAFEMLILCEFVLCALWIKAQHCIQNLLARSLRCGSPVGHVIYSRCVAPNMEPHSESMGQLRSFKEPAKNTHAKATIAISWQLQEISFSVAPCALPCHTQEN